MMLQSNRTIQEVEFIRRAMMMERDSFLPNWRLAARFVSPRRFVGTEIEKRNPIPEKTRQIFDSTAGMSSRTFVAGMMNGATSAVKPWWILEPMDERVKDQMTMRLLHNITSITNQSFRASNLYRILPQSYKDLSIFSNSAFMMLPHPRYSFNFVHLPVGTYCIGSDSEGIVNRFQRDYVLSVRQVVEQFGRLKPNGQIDWSNFNAYVKHEYERGNYHSSVQLSNLILPNHNPIPDSLMPEQSMKYVSYHWIRNMDNSNGMNAEFYTGFRYSNQPDQGVNAREYGLTDFVAIKGYNYFPVIANRWEVAPNSDYGIDGPAELALGEIISLQDQEKDLQDGIAKMVRPPMVAPAKMKRHHSSIMAGGITYVDEESQGTKYRAAFDILPSLGELLNSRGDYRAVVRKAFYEDLFLMMNSEEKISHVTAEEIRERSSEKLVGIGPALGQIDQDQNSRLIGNALILQSRVPGKLPEIPERLREKQFRPEYISILAQAQKASLISSQDNFINFVVTLADATNNPALKSLIKGAETVRKRADFLGYDPNLIATEEEYTAIVQGMNQKVQQNEALQQQNMASGTIKNLAGASGTPMGEDMLRTFGQMAERL